jgi:photoactive yellow protein
MQSIFLPSFETQKIAEAVVALTSKQIDELPFGVVKLDQHNLVCLRNRAEDKLFPQTTSVLGRLFFVDVAPCLNNEHFKGRIDKAQKEGTLDITYTFASDSPDSELMVRAQSAEDGGTWIFTRRA